MVDNIWVSLGIFGIVLAVLVLLLLLYFGLKCLAVKVALCNKIRNILKAKLFYNVWVRYMIESNLNVTHDTVFFLALQGSFDT